MPLIVENILSEDVETETCKALVNNFEIPFKLESPPVKIIPLS